MIFFYELTLIIIIVYKVFFLIVNLSPIVVVLFALFIVCIKIFMHPLIVCLLIVCIMYKWLHAYTCNDYSNMKTLLSPQLLQCYCCYIIIQQLHVCMYIPLCTIT